jgi:hypothetical protein
MSVSVVNGYLCMSGCDAAKARRGENPRESANPAIEDSRSGAGDPDRRDPAVRFGGTLAALGNDRQVTPVQALDATSEAYSHNAFRIVDRLI